MSQPILTLLASLMMSLAATAAVAQPKATPNPGGISMKSVRELKQSGVGPKVIGGRPARTENWPASFYAGKLGEKATCSATLIGPRTLLLAAHCVGNGQDATIKIDGEEFSGPCTHPVEYRGGEGDESADIAICKLSREVSGIRFETVNLDPARVKKGELVLLTGYGCTSPQESRRASGTANNKFLIGEAKIVALPGETEPNTILTRDKVTVCHGDSGGGAYITITASKRLIAAVNSRVWFEKGESYLSSLSSDVGRGFLDKWVEDNQGEKICGFNAQGPQCR